MWRSALYLAGLVFLSGFSCRADLTIRYTTETKIDSGMPAALTDQMKQQMSARLPKERVTRIKGDKTVSGIESLTVIVDSARAEVTLLDPATKQYARMSMADYFAALEAAMPAPAAGQKAPEGMKFDVQSSKTGQTAMVYGIRAEEHLTTLSISMTMPNAPAAPRSLMRMEMRTWLASPDDLTRIPGLREYAGSVERAFSVFDSKDAMKKMFSQMPGIGEQMRGFADAMSSNAGSLTVKTQETLYMPLSLAALTPDADPNAPVMEIEMHLTEISTDGIEDSVFAVPSDYREATNAELIKALMPAAPPATLKAAATAPAAQRLLDLAPGEAVSRVGSGVSAPAVIFKREPEYTEAARSAKLSGSVLLAVVVDRDGTPRNIQIVRGLGMGLDEKAVEAVRQWKFRPGQKDGQPVNVRATIEVNFRLLLRPPQQ